MRDHHLKVKSTTVLVVTRSSILLFLMRTCALLFLTLTKFDVIHITYIDMIFQNTEYFVNFDKLNAYQIGSGEALNIENSTWWKQKRKKNLTFL